MKRSFFLFTIALCTGIARVCAGGAAQDFTLINRTPFDLHSIYITPHGTHDWHEDVMGSEMLFPNDVTGIRYDRAEKAASWDLKAVDKEGKEHDWTDLHFPEIAKITLRWVDGKPTATTE